MTTQLFGRRATVQVGTGLTALEFISGDVNAGLRVAFTIARSVKPEPNTCEIKVWNLSKATRTRLEQAKELSINVEAGYSIQSQLFLGSLRTAISSTEGPDIVTTIGSGDGEKAYSQKRINVSIPKGTPLAVAVDNIILAMGIGPGNKGQHQFSFANGTTIFSNGTVISGSASRELTHLLRSAGLTWSIQNGALQVLQKRGALLADAVLLSSATGMIGSPTVNNKGELSASCLMIPGVEPGKLLVVASRHAEGNYRIEKCTYRGDTHAVGEWTIDIDGKRL